jgi:hypothetical protein
MFWSNFPSITKELDAMLTTSRYVDIVLLSLAYALGIVMLFGNVFVTPIAAIYLTEGNSKSRLQTVPLSVLIGCSALVIPLCGVLFSALKGYKVVFVLGATLGMIGSVANFLAVYLGSPGSSWAFPILCVGCGLQGVSYGVIHFYRHCAATELSTDSFKPWAIAIVLSGGIIAGFCFVVVLFCLFCLCLSKLFAIRDFRTSDWIMDDEFDCRCSV